MSLKWSHVSFLITLMKGEFYPLLPWPFKQTVSLSFLAQVYTQPQLVAVPRGEEQGTVEGGGLAQDSIPPPSGQLRHLPDVYVVVSGG